MVTNTPQSVIRGCIRLIRHDHTMADDVAMEALVRLNDALWYLNRPFQYQMVKAITKATGGTR